jgi:hypothetical protein
MDLESPSEVASDNGYRGLEAPSDEGNLNSSSSDDFKGIKILLPIDLLEGEYYDSVRKTSSSSHISYAKPYQSVSSISTLSHNVSLEALTELCVQVIVNNFKGRKRL